MLHDLIETLNALCVNGAGDDYITNDVMVHGKCKCFVMGERIGGYPSGTDQACERRRV